MFLPVLEVRAQGPRQQQHARHAARDDESQRKDALAVRLVGRVLLLDKHGVQMGFVAMGLSGGGSQAGQPRDREHDPCLGELPGVRLRHVVADRAVVVHRHRPVERPMSPGAHVLARHHLFAGRNGKGQRHGDVGRRLGPLGAHVLPIHFGDVLKGLHAVDDRVVDGGDHGLVGSAEEHVQGVLRLVERIGSRAGAAFVAPRRLERHALQVDGGVVRARAAVCVRTAARARMLRKGQLHAVYLHLRPIGKIIERPPHRRVVAAELERARFHHMERPVRLGLGGNVHLRHVVGPSERLLRRAHDQQQRASRQRQCQGGACGQESAFHCFHHACPSFVRKAYGAIIANRPRHRRNAQKAAGNRCIAHSAVASSSFGKNER